MQPACGVLHLYSKTSRQACFEFGTPDEKSAKVVLFVGGLRDGFLTVPYLPGLVEAVRREGWGLVQACIQSSYDGYGVGSLARDVDDLIAAVTYLRTQMGKKAVILAGHSTGCQDTISYLLRHADLPATAKIDGAILQTPVSDRQTPHAPAELIEKFSTVARHMVEHGKSEELLERKADLFTRRVPMTAYRFLSLFTPGGDDDFFSDDIDDHILDRWWATIAATNLGILILMSEEDEFVPKRVDKLKLIERWELFYKRNGGSKGRFEIVKDADHDVKTNESQEHMFSQITAWLKAMH